MSESFRTNRTTNWFPMETGFGASPGAAPQMPAGLPASVPLFRVLNEQGWFGPDDTLHPRGSVIAWDGGLNEHLEPLNQAAEDRMREYLDHLDRMGELKAELEGRTFIRRAGDLGEVAAEAMANRPKFERSMPRSNPDAPIRPDMQPAAAKRAALAKRAKQLLGVQEPPQQRPNDQAQKVVNVLGSTYTGDAQKDAR